MNLYQLKNTELFRLFVVEGSQAAISLYFQNQTDLFYRVALKYTRNAADAEDVLQASFINIISKACQYKGVHTDEEKLLQSWCLSVVVQCALMKIRSDSSRRQREMKYSTANDKSFQEERKMETNLENQAIYKKVEKVIFELPEKYRIPIHLKYIEGLELDAISEILKLNGNTLRSLIKRGLEKVSLQLKEENVALSSVGLIGMIQEMPMEQAPLAVKSIAAKIFETSANSSRLLLSPQNTGWLSLKSFTLFACLSLVTIGIGYFSFALFQKKITAKTIEQKQKMASNAENFVSEDANQTWDFKNENDRNLKLLLGKWIWSEEKSCMVPNDNSTIVVSLPIKPLEKPILLDLEIGSYFPDEIKSRTTFFLTGWVKENNFAACEAFVRFDPNYLFDRNKISHIKIYLYKNYVCFYMSEKSYNLVRYKDDLSGSHLAFATTYFMFRKITKTILADTPHELLDTIKNHENQVGQVSDSIKIAEENFYHDKLTKSNFK